MEFINKFTQSDNNAHEQNTAHQTNQQQSTAQSQSSETGGFGSLLGKFSGGGQQQNVQSGITETQSSSTQGGGSFFSGLEDKMNSAAGGGRESEKNEDYLDKGIDFVQQKFMGAGPQDNESAIEQAKDEQISDFIRGKYKGTTGSDMPIKDKPTQWD